MEIAKSAEIDISPLGSLKSITRHVVFNQMQKKLAGSLSKQTVKSLIDQQH